MWIAVPLCRLGLGNRDTDTFHKRIQSGTGVPHSKLTSDAVCFRDNRLSYLMPLAPKSVGPLRSQRMAREASTVAQTA